MTTRESDTLYSAAVDRAVSLVEGHFVTQFVDSITESDESNQT